MATKQNNRRSRRRTRLQGSYVGHFRGFGFFVPDKGGDDLFVPPGREGNAIDGDTVEVEPIRDDTVRVVRVIQRGRKLLAGTFLGKQAFSPDAHHIGRILTVSGAAAKGDKILVSADIDGFTVERVLGRSGAPDVEDAAVLAELDIEPQFPAEVIAEAESKTAPSESDLGGRLDLRDMLTVVTIDPVTSRDFDDAISVNRDGDDWLLGVHIADVSHYVQPGSELDREAHRRGTSVYLPNRAIPMLPQCLSNDLCSLREGADRLALSVLLHYDAEGNLQQTRFVRSVIRPHRRFSYERASRVMDGSRRESGKVGQVLSDMLTLAGLLRHRRDSLELPRTETEMVYDASGNVVDLRSIAADAAHGVIEEFMLAANRAVARLMRARGVPILYRHHPAPDDLTHVWDTLALLDVADAQEKGLQEAVSEAIAKGHGPTVASAVFRCMSRAEYTTGASSHFNLAFDTYCHFTSPIRRYADLAVHRQMHSLLASRNDALILKPDATLVEPAQDAGLDELAEHLNSRAAAADRAESRCRRRRVLEFLLRQGAVPTTGQITGVVEKGLIVDLPEYGVSGFLAADMLPGDPPTFEPGALTSGRRTYRLGQDLEVCIHRIDPAASQLDLALAPRL